MDAIFSNPWPYLVICFSIVLVTSLWMTALARRFSYTDRNGEATPFSILDTQLPSSEQELCDMIKGMSTGTQQALRTHLRVDFFFMAGTYPSIALLCILIGNKTGYGQYFFWLVAFLQLFAWIFDILENIYCLQKLRHPVVSDNAQIFRRYTFNVYAKFLIAITGLAITLPLAFYFWMSGDYWPDSLWYAGLMLAEVLVFFFVSKRIKAAA